MTLNDIANFVNSIGFSATVALTLAYTMWRVVSWFKPWGEKLIQNHIVFTTTIAETQIKQLEVQRDTRDFLESLHAQCQSGKKAVGYVANAIQELAPQNKDVKAYVDLTHKALME